MSAVFFPSRSNAYLAPPHLDSGVIRKGLKLLSDPSLDKIELSITYERSSVISEIGGVDLRELASHFKENADDKNLEVMNGSEVVTKALHKLAFSSKSEVLLEKGTREVHLAYSSGAIVKSNELAEVFDRLLTIVAIAGFLNDL